MTAFRPKSIFRAARREEKLGKLTSAAGKYAKLGVFLLERKKFDDAHILLKRSVRLSPTSCRPMAFLALCEKLMNREEVALETVRKFTRSAARQKKLDHYRGFVEKVFKKQPQLRAAYYESVLELDRTSINWFLGLARALVDSKNDSQARKVLLEALQTRGDDEKTLDLLLPVLERLNLLEHIHFIHRFRKGKIPRDELMVLISDFERTPASSQNGEGESLTYLIEKLEDELGIEAEQGRDNVNALLNEFRVQAEPILEGSPQARLDMALAYREMGLGDVALEEIGRIPDRNALYLEGQFLKGQILFDEGSDLGALEAFQSCLRRATPGSDISKESLYKLIHVYQRLGDVKQAWVNARKLSEFDENYRDNVRLKKEIEAQLGIQKGARKRA